MRMLKMMLLVAPLVLAGCILTTGQITIDFDLGTITVSSPTNLEARDVDLNTISDYTDHKDNLEGLADLALLGTVTNNGSSTINVEAYITTSQTAYTTETQVRTNGTKIWGPFTVPGSSTVTVGWDESAKLFTPVGKALLLDEIKGDGIFTVYLLGTAGTYNFTVNDGTLVLTLDAGL